MRSISRVVGVSINTVTKLLVQAGEASRLYHDEHVQNVPAKRVQCGGIWSFVCAKQKNVAREQAAPKEADDVWTWTAIDTDSKLIVSHLVGGRDADYATEFMADVAQRLTSRVQLTTDGYRTYLDAVGFAFRTEVDYAQVIKLYGAPAEPEKRYSPAEYIGIRQVAMSGSPNPDHISTSYNELRGTAQPDHADDSPG